MVKLDASRECAKVSGMRSFGLVWCVDSNLSMGRSDSNLVCINVEVSRYQDTRRVTCLFYVGARDGERRDGRDAMRCKASRIKSEPASSYMLRTPLSSSHRAS